MVNVLSWLTGREDKTGQPSPLQYDDGQPSLRAYNPAPSEQFSQWMAGLLGAGPGASLAKQNFATGVPSLLAASPLGIGLSAVDLIHAKNANDPMGAAAAAIGMVPGLKPEVQAVRQGIRAFHGSPHDFDRFDISKIGSGEGAQAYGHGLYFAENEGVARSYRDMLAGQDTPERVAKQYLTTGKGDPAKAIAALESDLVRYRKDPSGLHDWGQTLPSAENALQLLKSGNPIVEKAAGKMYEVNINAKPEQFLDWDRPLANSQQGAIKNVADEIHPSWYERMMGEGKDLAKWSLTTPNAYNASKTGQNIYGTIKRGLGSDEAASSALQEAGIPGIRYLDQGSRGLSAFQIKAHSDGFQVTNLAQGQQSPMFKTKEEANTWKDAQGTRNYVLFNDQLVDIMRKYGLATPAAAGAASYAMQPQEAQAGKAQPAQFQQPVPLSDRINQMIDSLQWGDKWQRRMRLPLQNKVNSMLGESVWPPLR